MGEGVSKGALGASRLPGITRVCLGFYLGRGRARGGGRTGRFTAAAAAFAARSDAYAIHAGPRRTASHPFATQAARASDWSSSNANMRATRY